MDTVVSLVGFGFCLMIIVSLVTELVHFAARTIGFGILGIIFCKAISSSSNAITSIKSFADGIANAVQNIDLTNIF